MKANKYQKNGIVGICELIKYIKTKNLRHLKSAVKYKDEIRFWTLITFFQNNHDLIFDSIDQVTLEELFTMKKIIKARSSLLYDNASYYDYGVGIVTNSKLDYLTQFKIIRNAIAHNSFNINDDGTISINVPDYQAIIDIKWLEAAIMCTLSTRNYQFRSGLHDSFLITLNRTDKPSRERFLQAVDDKTIGIIKLSLETNSISKACEVLSIKEGKYTFHDIHNYIRDLIYVKVNKLGNGRELNSQEYFSIIKKVISELNKQFNGAILISYIPFTRSSSMDLIDMEEFDDLESYANQAEVLLNHYKRELFPELENTLSFKYIVDVLNIMGSSDKLPPIYEIYLLDAYNLLIKALGNLVFNSLVTNMDGYKVLSSRIFSRYKDSFKFDFGHAKNHYKEIIKKLNNTLEDARKNGFIFEGFKELKKVPKTIQILTDKIKMINEGINPEVFINQLRNMFTHGYVNASRESIRLFDIKPDTSYYKYSKDKKAWDEKKVSGVVIFNAEMSYEVFMKIIRDICREFDISLDDKSYGAHQTHLQ